MATTDIRLRVPKEMKTQAEEIFEHMGMTMSEAMRIFLSQCINTGGLPFKPHARLPNAETLEAFGQMEEGNYQTYSLDKFEEMLDDLNKK
jgi:DNA-damage-inducible protein J